MELKNERWPTSVHFKGLVNAETDGNGVGRDWGPLQ